VNLRLVVPGRIDQATGGYRYAAAMLGEWRRAGHRVALEEIALTPASARACLGRVAEDETLLIDGLALPIFDGLVLPAGMVALIHHPLGLENGVDVQKLADETARLAKIARIVATSAATKRDLETMGVARGKIAVVEPGTSAARMPLVRRTCPTILCVATLTPRKDHVTLLRALAKIRGLRWRADLVGSTLRDAACAARIRAERGRHKLAGRVRLAGERTAEDLARHYRCAHVFALASLHEGYGMAFSEALAHRLPVAGVRAGAVTSVVPPQAGILVRPRDARALAKALRRLLGFAGKRYARNAAGLRFPDWPLQAERFLRILA
jgi:glycosyltransferase involved in cell wall biosynthesis